MTQITYIAVNKTHRIEVMPGGNHYPQRLINPALGEYTEAWAYDRLGNKARHFKTEAGARKFIARWGVTDLQQAWNELQAVPAYVERRQV